MIEMNPCKCGGPVTVVTMHSDGLKMAVCNRCGVHTGLFLTDNEAREAWNKREDGK